MHLKTLAALPLVVFLALAPSPSGQAAGQDPATEKRASSDPTRKIEDAIRTLEEMMDKSDKSIPVGLIEKCAGIVILPDVIRAGFIVGGRHGKGALLVRTAEGWSDPSFVDIKGGSFGWQLGVQSADIILVFRTARSIEDIAEGKFTLGADAGVAAGPLGRTAEASTDAALKAEILAYSRSRGIYAGLALQGSSLQEDRGANRDFYGADLSPKDILAGRAQAVPEVVSRLKGTLARLVEPAL